MSKYIININNTEYSVKILSENQLSINDKIYSFEILSNKNSVITVKIENKIFNTFCEKINETFYNTWIFDHIFPVKIQSELMHSLDFKKRDETSSKYCNILAPMPGLIGKIFVTKGSKVSVGDRLLTLEAMKMENEIRSFCEGVINEIFIEKGKVIEKGEKLITIETTS